MHLAMGHLLKLATILLRCIPPFFRSRNEQAIVELTLRQQLATYSQKGRRPRITPADRGFWVFLSQVWPRWKEILVIVQLNTVVRWHRRGFRLYWRSISKHGPGRPVIPAEVQALIRRFANENGWRARKVRAELAKLGISVGLATVSRYLPKRKPDHHQCQRWRTFLHNHRHGIAERWVGSVLGRFASSLHRYALREAAWPLRFISWENGPESVRMNKKNRQGCSTPLGK